MSKITIEEINGKEYTVVWHANMSENYMRSELTWLPMKNGCLINYPWGAATHIATALPALPRNPEPEDAALLYRYMAEGIAPRGNYYDSYAGKKREDHSALSFMTYMWECNNSNREITHATHNDQRVKIAITDEAHNG